MADTTVLLFTSSLFIPVLGVTFLSEKVGPFRWTAVIVGFIGVLIMMRPSGQMYLLGIAVAMAAVFMQATLFGWVIWNDVPLPTVIAGATIIIASNVLVIWREHRLGKVVDPRLTPKV